MHKFGRFALDVATGELVTREELTLVKRIARR